MPLKALFIITITTARMVFPGLPILPGASPGEVPKEAVAVSKSINFELTSPKPLAQGVVPTAKVDVPEGLGVGSMVKLRVNAQAGFAVGGSSSQSSKVISKTYWGSSETIPWGQPKTEEALATPPAQDKIAVDAYWPAGVPGEKVAGPDAKAAGKYSLTTNYCAGAGFTLTDAQNYLGPINLLGLSDKIDLAKAIKVKWTPVPRAVGYVVTAFGGNAKESITWTSRSKPDIALAIPYTPVTKQGLGNYIKDSVILPSYMSVCTVPAGIFKDATSVIFTVTAIGTDVVQTGSDVDTHVLVRSIASFPVTPEPASN